MSRSYKNILQKLRPDNMVLTPEKAADARKFLQNNEMRAVIDGNGKLPGMVSDADWWGNPFGEAERHVYRNNSIGPTNALAQETHQLEEQQNTQKHMAVDASIEQDQIQQDAAVEQAIVAGNSETPVPTPIPSAA